VDVGAALGRSRSKSRTLQSAAGEANVKTRKIATASFYGVSIIVCILAPGRLMAQAPAGPLAPAPSQTPPPRPVAKPKPPEVQPRTSLDGTWKFNRDESDDPRTKTQESKPTQGGNGGGHPGGGYPGGGYPGRYPGGGYPGGGYPGGGGGPSGGRGNGGWEVENDEKILDLIRPAATLTFTLKNAEVDVTDDHYNKTVFCTDGRQLQKSKDSAYQEIAAHWNGSQLVSDEKSPRGGTMSRVFELSQDGRHAYETVHIDRGKSKGMLVVRYVYDIVSHQSGRSGHDSDPEQPVLKRHSDDVNTSSPTGAQTGTDPDPNQPVLKRHSGDSSNSSP
jgi:hypothetical protein